MSTKKRFTIAPELASGIRSTIQSASNNQGQMHYDMMSLDVIEPDPLNPRKLLIAREEILNGVHPADPHYSLKQKEREALNELSESIKRIGIKNAIEVYKNGLKYRIVTGERRYWAALLAGQKSVPARVSQKPEEFNLRYTQWVENINRQDLSLLEKYHNLVLIADSYQKSNRGQLDEQSLQSLLGISTTQAYRYHSLLTADKEIIDLIKSGKVKNLKIVQELASMKDKGARRQILHWSAASKEELTSLTKYKGAAGKKSSSAKTKNATSISLGKISNTKVAKEIFELMLADHRLQQHRSQFRAIDWSSAEAIAKAFKSLFKTMELEF